MAIRAIHTHRNKFLTLTTQEKRDKLVTIARTLATLKSKKVKAHNRLMKASAPKLIQECKLLLTWKTPAGGLHTLLQASVMAQGFKVSQPCQPLQLPFQLLLPPDFHLLNCSKSAQSASTVQVQGKQASTRDREGPSNFQAAVLDLPPMPDPRPIPGLSRPAVKLKACQRSTSGPLRPTPDLPPEPDPTGPDSVKSTPGLPRPTLCRPMPAPDPDPPDKEVSLKSKQNWG